MPHIVAVLSRERVQIKKFHVQNFRSIHNSGWINVSQITSFVGPNESGKSNLCEALYLLNPFDETEDYNIDEDWPADNWGDKKKTTVCSARFQLDAEEIADLAFALGVVTEEDDAETDEETTPTEKAKEQPPLPKAVELSAWRGYWGKERGYKVSGFENPDKKLLKAWADENIPKCVYIRDYELSGAQVELDQLAQRKANPAQLTTDDRMLLIILELAQIELDDFIAKGSTAEGRTLRSYDRRQASSYLTNQFARLWKQKDVRFEIEVDATTLNVFVEDKGLGMPIRLNRRSTGFRWYVSFAWKFTHATRGQYKDSILLLEEPGVHLHHAGHQDLLDLFEELSEDNTILYTTHLSTMIDPGFPERIRIVEIHDHHTQVIQGIVSSQPQPMMVVEASLGLTGSMSGLLGNRKTLIVEGGDDSLILQKLSSVLIRAGKVGLSDQIYLWAARSATKTPMHAGFLVGHKWDGAVLLDSDEEGELARDKIQELYLDKLAEDTTFDVLMLAAAAGIKDTPAAIEELFPEKFFLDCVNRAYGLAMTATDLPSEGTIKSRVKYALKAKHDRDYDPDAVLGELLKEFDKWDDVKKLPTGTAVKAEKLFKAINAAFE